MPAEDVGLHLSDDVVGRQLRGELLFRYVRIVEVDGREQRPEANCAAVALLVEVELAAIGSRDSILVDGGFIEDSDLQMSMAVPCFRRLCRVLCQARHQVRRTECINVANHGLLQVRITMEYWLEQVGSNAAFLQEF